MAKDFNQMAVRFGEIADGIDRGVNLITQRAAKEALYYLAYYTPLDVGTARSNWIVSATGGDRIRRAFSPYPSRWKPRKGVNPGGSRGEVSNLNSVLRSGNSAIVKRRADQDLYITNSLPYIIPLNSGHSKQVAPGWVRRAVSQAHKAAAADAVRILRREIR